MLDNDWEYGLSCLWWKKFLFRIVKVIKNWEKKVYRIEYLSCDVYEVFFCLYVNWFWYFFVKYMILYIWKKFNRFVDEILCDFFFFLVLWNFGWFVKKNNGL